ncbi:cell division cycle protein 20 homolog B-like [Heterodontus francisci]|uniref:cell division cycle protein 20 homolog B-like n=1 Tax=Heterodontus francisci TaxID=7792 RepID=UPI00355C5872
MEWELERFFPRKSKTGEEMQWEKIMKKLANETKWNSQRYVHRLFKVAERGKLTASQFKTRSTGNKLKWELPSPVASSSPIVARWRDLQRREYRSAAASSGAPVVTVIEAEGRTRTGAVTGTGAVTLTGAATKAKAMIATDILARDECGSGVEVVIMIQADEGTLIAAEGETGAGAENETRSEQRLGLGLRQ